MEGEKKRRMASGLLILPSEWKEINPQEAKTCEYIAICSDGQNHTAIWYLKDPLDQLNVAQAAEIILSARALGLGADTSIYGFVESEKFNNSGAKLIKK